MEHRYGERAELNLRVNIFKLGLLAGRGVIKTASQSGLYLQTEYADIQPLQRLVLDVVIHSSPLQSVHYKLRTMVIHCDGGGLGLEFVSESDAMVMIDLIRAQQEQPLLQAQQQHILA
jgi:hypothetical protein